MKLFFTNSNHKLLYRSFSEEHSDDAVEEGAIVVYGWLRPEADEVRGLEVVSGLDVEEPLALVAANERSDPIVAKAGAPTV